MNLRQNQNCTLEAALTETIDVVGSKKLGSLLRPRMDVEQAGKWIRRVAKPYRAEKINIDDLITAAAIGRRHNCHALMRFIGSRAGYRIASPVQRSDQIEQLRRKAETAERELATLRSAIQSAESDPMTVTMSFEDEA